MLNKQMKEIKFNEIANEWLRFKKVKIKESTYLKYRFTIYYTFFKFIGEKTLKELLDYDYNNLIQELMNTLSAKTVRDEMSILKSILRYAELKYDVNFKLNLINVPTVYKKEINIFTERDRKRMERVCLKSGNIKYLGVLISLYTGLRIGEVCALKWKDFDFENKLVNVTHTIQRGYVDRLYTKVIYTTPKTQSSIRKIPLSEVLYNKLKPISQKYPEEAFVLSGRTDKWIEPLGYRYTYRKILNESKVKYKKYHTLRHTFATRCVRIGMDTKSLSEILGHANVVITLNTYIHSSFETKVKYINKL